MADRLTADQLAQLTGPEVVSRPRYTLTIDSVDYTDYLITAGKVKWQITNYHPLKQRALRVPILPLKVDNRDGLFTVGNASGPFTTETDRVEAVVVLTVKICSPALTVLSFTGGPRQPHYDDKGYCYLEIEHPLKMASERVWSREDSSESFYSTTTSTLDLTP